MARNQPVRRRGFTLIELVMSMAIGAILLGGMGSAILISSHALPGSNTTTDAILRTADVVEQMAGELHCAVTFKQRTATLVEFTVPDRDGDLAPETILYTWTGTPGDPLKRQYNAGTMVIVAEGVQEFDLGYTKTSVTTTETTDVTTNSGEILLSWFDGWSGLTETPQDFGVDSDYWAAEFVSLALPDFTNKVTITRVRLRMRQGNLGNAGTFSVGIHRFEGGGKTQPHQNTIGTPVVRSASTLSAGYLWEEFVFSDVTINNGNKAKAIVVKGTAAAGNQGDAEVLRYYNSNGPQDDPTAMWTTNGGTSWDPKKNDQSDYDFPHYLYGEYETTALTPVDVTRYYLGSVQIKLRLGADAGTRVQTSAQVLNAPEVP